MDDKCIMEDLLITTKSVCELYHHGTVEASTANVHEAFQWAMNEALNMQNGLYNDMTSKGWYSTDEAPTQKASQLKQKYEQVSF